MSIRICPNCGSQNPPESTFCVQCGASFEAAKAPERKKRKEIPVISEPKVVPTTTPVSRPVKASTGAGMLPYVGDSIRENDNATLKGKPTVGCGAASSALFNVYFQQRNKLIVNIEEGGEVLEDSSMDGLRGFFFPNILKEKYSKKDLMDMYVNTPMKDPDIGENYGLMSYSPNEKINFGYILFAAPNLEFDDQVKIQTSSGVKTSKYVIPLLSKINYADALSQKMPGALYPVDMEWNSIKEKFMEDDEIKYSLFAKDETKFRWEHPLSLKIEIEDYNYSLLKAFNTKEHSALWKTAGVPMVDSSRLATVRITLSNTTYYQIFYSDLTDVDLYLHFETTFKELIQPSALKFPPGTPAEYILEEKAINWKVTGQAPYYHLFKPGWTRTLVFHLDRDIIDKIDGFHVNISGKYTKNPQMFNSYTYITPMGFPVKINSQSLGKEEGSIDVEWNPGRVQLREKKIKETGFSGGRRGRKSAKGGAGLGGTSSRVEIASFIPDDDNKVTDYFEEFQPAFFQEVRISKENLTKSSRQPNYVEVLNNGSEFILGVQQNIKKMGTSGTKKFIFSRGKGDGGA